MSKKISIRRQFINKFNVGEDVVIRGPYNDIRKAKIVKFGAKKLHSYYYSNDENGKYGELSWHSLYQEHYEFIDVIKRGNPEYEKYFNEYIDESNYDDIEMEI